MKKPSSTRSLSLMTPCLQVLLVLAKILFLKVVATKTSCSQFLSVYAKIVFYEDVATEDILFAAPFSTCKNPLLKDHSHWGCSVRSSSRYAQKPLSWGYCHWGCPVSNSCRYTQKPSSMRSLPLRTSCSQLLLIHLKPLFHEVVVAENVTFTAPLENTQKPSFYEVMSDVNVLLVASRSVNISHKQVDIQLATRSLQACKLI